MKKRGLGRNLDVFLSRTNNTAVAPVVTATVAEMKTPATSPPVNQNELRKLPVDLLQRGRYQPRKEFAQEQLQELADSIRSQGIIQPIVVRSVAAGRYEIIAGERRWRAAQLAGLSEVPALVKELPDEAALAIAIIENIQREDLNPLEEAVGLQRLINEFGLTQNEVAESVGKSRTTITNLLRLLSLQSEVKTLLENGDIEMGHAKALLALDGLDQVQTAKIVADKGLSVRETEGLVRKWNGSANSGSKSPVKSVDPDIRQLQQKLSDKLGAHVALQHTAKGAGKLVIKYNSLDELDGILEHIQ